MAETNTVQFSCHRNGVEPVRQYFSQYDGLPDDGVYVMRKNGSVYDLTGYVSAALWLIPPGGAVADALVYTVTVTDAVHGEVEWDPGLGALDVPGVWRGKFVFVFGLPGSERQVSFPNTPNDFFEVEVSAGLQNFLLATV